MSDNAILSAVAFVAGLIVGSFLNVVIYRIPRGQSIVFPRSRCPACGAAIAWYDNIPVLSYLLLHARCRTCRAPISARYPAVEIATGVIAGGAVWSLGATLEALWIFVFFSLLVAITIIDWSHRIIPDSLSLGGMLFGWVGAALCLDLTLADSLLGSLIGGGLLFLVALAYRLVRKVDGMGGGDVKLMAMIGAYVGWQLVFSVLVLASVAGAAYGVYLMRRGASSRTAVAFGSFLAPSAALIYVLGHTLWRAYLQFLVSSS